MWAKRSLRHLPNTHCMTLTGRCEILSQLLPGHPQTDRQRPQCIWRGCCELFRQCCQQLLGVLGCLGVTLTSLGRLAWILLEQWPGTQFEQQMHERGPWGLQSAPGVAQGPTYFTNLCCVSDSLIGCKSPGGYNHWKWMHLWCKCHLPLLPFPFEKR